jgi:hypothetical protein
VDIWMSDIEDGPQVRSVSSATQQIWAVVRYVDAGERFRVQLRDLSGIVVKTGDIQASGTATGSVGIHVMDFVNTYLRAFDKDGRGDDGVCASPACVMQESVHLTQEFCQDIPPVPSSWPGPPVQPTAPPGQPTPTPEPRYYRLWLDEQLSQMASSRSAMAEISRTIQSMLAMPDVKDDVAFKDDLGRAQTAIGSAYSLLRRAEAEMNPTNRLPTPEEGCRLVTEADTQIDGAITRLESVTDRAAQVPSWRLPPTSSRWSGDSFLGCLQYNTELYTVQGNQIGSTAVDSTYWTVGEPGKARLIFPKPDLADRNNVGELHMAFPEGADALYAKSVTVPNVNHAARISAFVTDAQCVPVDALTITFSVNPSTAGSVAPVTADVDNGVAMTDLEVGQDAVRSATVQGYMQTARKGDPGPAGISASSPFQVIGPARSLHFLMQMQREINVVEEERLAFSVQVRDEFGRAVADNTPVQVTIPQDDPGIFVYERRLREGRNQPVEIVSAGKSLEMFTTSGMSQFPEDPDPLYTRKGPFVACTTDLWPGHDRVTISAVSDGATANTNDNDGKTIICLTEHRVFAPLTFKGFDIRATPAALPIETPTPFASGR